MRYALRLANDGAGTARAVTAARRTSRSGDRAAAGRGRASRLDRALRRSPPRRGDRGRAFRPHPRCQRRPLPARPARRDRDRPRPGASLALNFVPPPAPLGLRTRGSDSSIVLAWDPVFASDLLGYEVERAPRGGAFVPITARPVTDATLTDSGLASLTDLRVPGGGGRFERQPEPGVGSSRGHDQPRAPSRLARGGRPGERELAAPRRSRRRRRGRDPDRGRGDLRLARRRHRAPRRRRRPRSRTASSRPTG